ncbi:MAG: PilZ domain-containing protein [Planctomycetota bacterium]|nr:PilZ domain-containing protein [Planctomycetota bacterium]
MKPHQTSPYQQNDMALDDRRAEERQEHRVPLKLTLETPELTGVSENISGVGVLFFTEGTLRVSVEIEGGRTRTGRLVRVQRMNLGSTGFAVEFDPE